MEKTITVNNTAKKLLTATMIQISETTISEAQTRIDFSEATEGVYFIHIIGEQGSETKKIIIRKQFIV